MSSEPKENGIENKEIVLGLLESVNRDSDQSHRRLAAELGVALGLINTYVRRCVSKGLLKVHKTPARRYAYFLTPKGFAEKSRLTASYLSHSFTLFRRAREECSELFERARMLGMRRFVLVGASDVTEIAALCAVESGITIVAVVDRSHTRKSMAGRPVFASVDDVRGKFDAVMVTAFNKPQGIYEELADRLGAAHVFVPGLLGVRPERNGAGSER